MPAPHAVASDAPGRPTNEPAVALVQVDMPGVGAYCPMGHAAHELAPLTDDTVPASHALTWDAPASTTNDPADAFVHADKPVEFAIWPR